MFKANQVYKRKDLQDTYGGNRRGGIASCAQHPYIFIFSGKGGEAFGYKDQWDSDQIYQYTGEGQVGDMVFKRGNKALKTHKETGKRVFLFETLDGGQCRFISELEYVDNKFVTAPDATNKERQAIRFYFKAVPSTVGAQ